MTILQLAKSLKLKVVAEGVETEEQYRLLKTMGCDQFQGYLFSRPERAERIEALIHRQQIDPAGTRPSPPSVDAVIIPEAETFDSDLAMQLA